MSAISNWNTTAANNTSAPPDGAPEGMYASKVNDTIREMMAQIRTWYNDSSWIIYGDGNGTFTITYASGTSFTVAGVDVTTVYVAGRRVKAVGTATGTIYGYISSSSFSTDTTVNVTWDSGSLSNESLTIYLGAMGATRLSDPVDLIRWGGTVGGTADAITLTPVPAITAYRTGLNLCFKATGTNTGPATIAVSGLSAQPLVKGDASTALAAEDIISGHVHHVVYDGTSFCLIDTPGWEEMPSGAVITRAYGEYTTNAALTTVIPFDDTIPQSNEGAQVISTTIVLKSAKSTVRVMAALNGTSSSNGYFVQAAVFAGSGADAINAGYIVTQADSPGSLVLRREYSPSLTGTVTFVLRVGPDNGSLRSVSLNGYTGNRRYGGVMRTTLLVEEIRA